METELPEDIKLIIKEQCNTKITNRKLLDPIQLERENRFFETKMSKDTIRHLINNNEPEPFLGNQGLMNTRIMRSFNNNDEGIDFDAPHDENEHYPPSMGF